jgi:hypothetical protein
VLHPESVEGCDYRVPSAQRFNEWRRYLEPICHFLAVTTIKLAVQTYLFSDATTKNHIHLLMALYRCELPNRLIVDVVSIFQLEHGSFALTCFVMFCVHSPQST